MTYVVDASVLLAILGDEPGGELALDLSQGGDMSWLNAGEVYSKVVERGGRQADAFTLMRGLKINFHNLIETDASAIAEMLPLTRRAGLSFGDRACLALGLRLGKVVLTAERRWTTVDVGVQVQLLR